MTHFDPKKLISQYQYTFGNTTHRIFPNFVLHYNWTYYRRLLFQDPKATELTHIEELEQ